MTPESFTDTTLGGHSPQETLMVGSKSRSLVDVDSTYLFNSRPESDKEVSSSHFDHEVF